MSENPNTLDVDTVLADMQNAVKGRLVADAWYAGMDIFTPDDMDESGKLQVVADIQQRVNQSLSAVSKGVCIIVSAPVLTSFACDAPDLYASDVSLLVRIIESPLVNRGATGTRKTASAIGIHSLRALWHFVYLGCTLIPRRAGLVPSEIKAGALIWDIVYGTKLDLASLETQPQESP